VDITYYQVRDFTLCVTADAIIRGHVVRLSLYCVR